jgi:hypothetical protein
MALLAIFISKVRRSRLSFHDLLAFALQKGTPNKQGADGPGRAGVVVISHRVKPQTPS